MKLKKIFKWGCLGTIALCILSALTLWIGTRNISNVKDNEIVQRAEARRSPNNDFTYCTNPSIAKSARRNYPVSGYEHPYTCINTATAIYDPHNTCSLCADFVANPKQWGFKLSSPEERKPGDIIIFYAGNRPAHSGIYIGESLLLGPLMNQSDGGYFDFDYQRHIPVKLQNLLWDGYAYYTYVGK